MEWKAELDAIVGARHGGKIDQVLPALRALAARYPNTPELVTELAFSLTLSGATAEALNAYGRALALGLPTPATQANALIGHATCLLRLQRAAEAVVALERARAQFPELVEFTAFLALARHRDGQTATAFLDLLNLLLSATEDVGLTAHQRTLRALATDAPGAQKSPVT
jgi:thioredoxin-like negative regulator of GroEL